MQIEITFYKQQVCPHCKRADRVLTNLTKEFPNLHVWKREAGSSMMDSMLNYSSNLYAHWSLLLRGGRAFPFTIMEINDNLVAKIMGCDYPPYEYERFLRKRIIETTRELTLKNKGSIMELDKLIIERRLKSIILEELIQENASNFEGAVKIKIIEKKVFLGREIFKRLVNEMIKDGWVVVVKDLIFTIKKGRAAYKMIQPKVSISPSSL